MDHQPWPDDLRYFDLDRHFIYGSTPFNRDKHDGIIVVFFKIKDFIVARFGKFWNFDT